MPHTDTSHKTIIKTHAFDDNLLNGKHVDLFFQLTLNNPFALVKLGTCNVACSRYGKTRGFFS